MAVLKIDQLSTSSGKRLDSLIASLDNDYVPQLSSIVDLNEYSKKLLENAVVLVATLDGADTGFIAFYAGDKETETAFVSSIGVLPNARGKSIGERLIKESESFCREIGKKTLFLEVSAINSPAIRLYGRMGFTRTKTPSKKTYSNALFFEKKL